MVEELGMVWTTCGNLTYSSRAEQADALRACAGYTHEMEQS